jgi:topoisomerase-4 subunit A
LFFTKLGAVKRSDWSEYGLAKNYMQAIKLKDGDEVINVEPYDDDEFSTMLFITKKALCLNAAKDDVPVQGRVAGGVKGINLSAGDRVVFATQHTGEGEVIVATTLGGFKRVISSTIDPIGRGCKGVMIADIKGKGEILYADYVTLPYSIAVVNSDKSVVEVNTEDISIENRVFKGKPLSDSAVKEVASVYSLKSRTKYRGGSMQMKF